MSVADYMSEVLTAPYNGTNRGYYLDNDPLGQQGDFITAPEISQIFGELLGLWLVNSWREADCPAKIILAELGPGRGTLMSDALRAARVVPTFIQAAELHLVEISPTLRTIQSQVLRDFPITWHNSFSEIPDGRPVFLVANEFFDALPIHQFEKSPHGWCERLITLHNDRLTFTLGHPSALIERSLTPQQQQAQSVTVLEYCPAGLALVEDIAHRIKQNSGAAIIIDYGYDTPPGTGTLQAVKKHKFHPVLDSPGTADLSALVNFSALVHAAHAIGIEVKGPTAQGIFLETLGIRQRAEKLNKNATPQQKTAITVALERLTATDQMGQLFKVITIQKRM